MLTAIEQTICGNLFKYINYTLRDYVDDELFSKSTLQELGAFYFNHVIDNVDDANDRLLKIVIRAIRNDKEISSISDFYLELCKIVGIKILPKDVMLSVQQEYNEVFVQLYNRVSQKADTKINSINTQLLLTKNSMKSLESTQPSLSLMRDLATEENLLQQYYRECNELRTEKEMILFSKQHIAKHLNKFCNLGEMQSVCDTLNALALSLAMDTVMNVSRSFSFYKDILEIAEDHLDRPYALFFKVKLYTAIDNLHKNWYYSSYTKTEEERVSELNLAKAKIPNIDDLHNQKISNPQQYLNTLRQLDRKSVV